MERFRLDLAFDPGLDPVCGMSMRRRDAYAHRRRAGLKLSFCSPGCVRRFDADPERYMRTKYMRECVHENAQIRKGSK